MVASEIFKLRRGNSPLLISMPHVGTKLPDWLVPRLSSEALTLPDTDWYLEELYDFLDDLDATVLSANYSRYVIDLNRSSDDVSLYPGKSVTGLCPLDTFKGMSIYHETDAPDAQEVSQRVEVFWTPYHQTLEAELTRIKGIHGSAVLWDAHSIRSQVPRFFDGQLPQLNIGTVNDTSCNSEMTKRISKTIEDYGDYSWVVNGRFKGGFITRYYGQTLEGINALQVEIAMRSYMNESNLKPMMLDKNKAKVLRPILKMMMINIMNQHEIHI